MKSKEIIDKLLDKISKYGYQNLLYHEKLYLDNVSNDIDVDDIDIMYYDEYDMLLIKSADNLGEFIGNIKDDIYGDPQTEDNLNNFYHIIYDILHPDDFNIENINFKTSIKNATFSFNKKSYFYKKYHSKKWFTTFRNLFRSVLEELHRVKYDDTKKGT